MSANFENGYDWSDDVQPQNLSRYPSDSVTNEELETVPQDYIHLFPSPLPESSDENLLKRSDLSASHYQERPINLAAVGDYRQIDMICPELASFDTIHQSSAVSINNTYGNYSNFAHTFPHNAPESYTGDRFLGLSDVDLECNGDHSESFINNLEAQFCPPHVSPLIYSTGFAASGIEDNFSETEIPNPDGAHMTAVLDLSPTVSTINKSSHAEVFTPYLLSNGDNGKHQLRQNGTYSTHLNTNESNPFKNGDSNSHLILGVKYEPPNTVPDIVSLPPYEEPIPNPLLLHYDFDHPNLGLGQPKKLQTKSIKDNVIPNGVCSEFLMEEKSSINKIYGEQHIPYREASSPYFSYESMSSLCSPSKSHKVVEQPDTIYEQRADNTFAEAVVQHRSEEYPDVELVASFNAKENLKSPPNYNEQRELNNHNKGLKEVKPVKKSERLRKAKVLATTEKAEPPLKQVQKVQKRKKKQVVTCRTCSAQFSEGHSLKIHHYSHTGERPFRCDECGNRFTKSSSLSVHRLKHTGEKPHSCSTCGKSFRLFSTLKSHLLTHTGEKPFWCELCLSKFTQRSALMRHKKMHLNLKPFKCDLCGNSFRDKFYFKKHIACHEMKAKHSCKVCGEGFYSNKRLQIHSMKHNEGPNPYKCNKCTAEFVSQKAWRQHKSRNHERKEELRCEDCDATFKRRESFKAHKKVHSGENLIKCLFCQAHFNNVGTLKKHMKKHENSAYSKDKKNTANNRVSNIVQPTANEISFPCCKCHRTFSTRRQLRTHRCYDKFDDSAHNSQNDDSRTNFEIPVHHDISRMSPVVDKCDALPISLFPAHSVSVTSGKYKSLLVGVPSGGDLRLNNDTDLLVDFSQATLEVSLQATPRNLKAYSRSNNHLILTKNCDPPSVPLSQESTAASLLSAVLQVADSGFTQNERKIS